MLQNPFLPSPSAASAWAEGFTKGFLAISSPEPGENVAAEDFDAFNQGVAAGEENARTGMVVGDPCIPAREGEPDNPIHDAVEVITVGEALHAVWELRIGKLVGGIAGFVVVLVELACTLPVHALPPEEVLPALGQSAIDVLVSYGLESMQLFCGAAVDVNATDCEIRVSPLFTSQEQARQAAINMNRPQWVVASWRTDQSNSFEIVDAGTI